MYGVVYCDLLHSMQRFTWFLCCDFDVGDGESVGSHQATSGSMEDGNLQRFVDNAASAHQFT